MKRVITSRNRPHPQRMYPQLPAALAIGLKPQNAVRKLKPILRYLPEIISRRRLAAIAINIRDDDCRRWRRREHIQQPHTWHPGSSRPSLATRVGQGVDRAIP